MRFSRAYFTTIHRELIISLSARHRMPAAYPFRYIPAEGGLISYGVDVADLHRRASSYVDRILKGLQPADLPIQAPTKFVLGINLKTAKTLGLDVPWISQDQNCRRCRGLALVALPGVTQVE